MCSAKCRRHRVPWLRWLVNAILGVVPGKPDRLDTARRMAMGADFTPRGLSKANAAVRRRGQAAAEKPVAPLYALQRLVKR